MNKLRKAVLIAMAGTALATVSTHASATVLLSGTGFAAGQSWNGNNNGYLGWGHNSDWFTFQATSTGTVDVKMTATAVGVQPAFTVWDTGSAQHTWSDGMTYNQISNETIGGNPAAFVGFANNYGTDAHFGSGPSATGLGGSPAYAGASVVTGNNAGFNFAELIFTNATAGEWFAIAAGGSSGGGAYSIAASSVNAVPIPGAIWLFGSAMVGTLGLGRRKPKAA